MSLWIKKDLGVSNILVGRSGEIGKGKFGKILFCAQNVHAGVVDIKERLQILEVVSLSEVFDRSIRNRNIIAFGYCEYQLGLKSALYVQMQFGLRQTGNKVVDDVTPSGCVK